MGPRQASDPEHEELVKILKKIDNGLEEDPKPAAAETRPLPRRRRRSTTAGRTRCSSA